MGFDAEGYRKAAKAQGISEEEIEKDIADEMRNVKPVNAAPEQSDVQIGGKYDWLIPAAVGTGIGLVGSGLAGKTIKDRLMSKPEAPRIEPSMDQSRYAGPGRIEPVLEVSPTEAPPKFVGTEEQKQQILKSEDVTAQKQMEAAKKATTPVTNAGSPVAPYSQARAAGMLAEQEMRNPLGGLASAYTEPLRPPPTVAEMTQQAGGAVSEAAKAPASSIPPAEKNKSGRPKGSKSLPAMKDTPDTWTKLTKEGVTFLPGYGPGDNNLFNTYGGEGRRAILEKYNEGKPIGSYENYLKLNEKLKVGVPSSEVPGLMARLPSEDEAGNFSKLGKAAKIAGVGGLLVSAANLANAKTPSERGLAGANLLGAIIPPAASITEAGAPVLPPSVLAAQQRQLQEMQKLGSPYRTR